MRSDWKVTQNTARVANALHLFGSQIHSVTYGSIEVAVHVHCANGFIRLMLLSEINDHTNQA